MHKQLELTTSKNNSFSPGFSVVSRFCIENTNFLVISLQTSTENENFFDPQTDSAKPFPVLGHFSYAGNHYAVVNTQNTDEDVDSNRINLLTARELQIAALVALGHSNKQVSARLHISEWTVSAHLRRIFIKLNVDSRAAMVYKCASLIDRLQQFQGS
jgi:DNA-binding CsgD family transcriptional regulator